MNKPMPPCGENVDCPKRSPDCHSNCIDFLFFQIAREKEREAITKEAIQRAAPIIRNRTIRDNIQKIRKRLKR